MKKKNVIFIIIFLLFSVALVLLYKTVIRIEGKKKVSANLESLPELKLLTTDSVNFLKASLRPNTSSVLIYFNSECQYCQYEAQEIKKNIQKFKDVNLLMISTEPLYKIRTFAKNYNLLNISHVQFLHINEEDVYETLGAISVPNIFIYGADQKLIKQYKGETKIEAILKMLKNEN